MIKNKKNTTIFIAPVLFFLAWTFFFVSAPVAETPDVEEIIKRSEDTLRGDTSYARLAMTVQTPRWTRSMEMESWSKGTEKSFIVITAPKKDAGITFLRIKSEMWQYVPRIEKVIKIPPSMMLQSWMGSDFTNDDMVRESSMADDYDKKLTGQTASAWSITLIPRPDAPVVWGKIVLEIDKKNYLPAKLQYYDEDMILIREFLYEDVKTINGRPVPMLWKIIPKTEDKQGHTTIIEVRDIWFDRPINESLFSTRSLKQRQAP